MIASLTQIYPKFVNLTIPKTARQKNPHPKGSLVYAAWVCARLGGWTGYYGKPGPIVMLRGLHTFRAHHPAGLDNAGKWVNLVGLCRGILTLRFAYGRTYMTRPRRP